MPPDLVNLRARSPLLDEYMPLATLRPGLDHGVTAAAWEKPRINAEGNSALGHSRGMRAKAARINTAREVPRGILAIEGFEARGVRAGSAEHLDLIRRKSPRP